MGQWSWVEPVGTHTAAVLIAAGIFVFLAVLNTVTYGFFQADKERAAHGEGRIPERTLLTLAACGGSLGAKMAQRRLRHKTRKQPFRRHLNMIVAAHLLFVLGGVLMIGSNEASAWLAGTSTAYLR